MRWTRKIQKLLWSSNLKISPSSWWSLPQSDLTSPKVTVAIWVTRVQYLLSILKDWIKPHWTSFSSSIRIQDVSLAKSLTLTTKATLQLSSLWASWIKARSQLSRCKLVAKFWNVKSKGATSRSYLNWSRGSLVAASSPSLICFSLQRFSISQSGVIISERLNFLSVLRKSLLEVSQLQLSRLPPRFSCSQELYSSWTKSSIEASTLYLRKQCPLYVPCSMINSRSSPMKLVPCWERRAPPLWPAEKSSLQLSSSLEETPCRLIWSLKV